ncbi:hypothetical protein [Vibrio splendidus]|uniref:hypothetical protein n=1 Tax=Vibrio splendidus TaxID=29497 RepID=UPI000D36D2FA|nr:hypothetical protein [Vibrio splendidus]PTP95462.1 hypothetical protein CWO02_01065 [Vibrio splendidus]
MNTVNNQQQQINPYTGLPQAMPNNIATAGQSGFTPLNTSSTTPWVDLIVANNPNTNATSASQFVGTPAAQQQLFSIGNIGLDGNAINPAQQSGMGSMGSDNSLGFNPLEPAGNTVSNGWEAIGGMQGLATGLEAVGNVWGTYNGMQAVDLAKDQFNFQKGAWEQDYNMRLEDYNRRVGRQDSKDAALAR